VVDGAEGAAVGEDSPLVDNEIARLYWKWFKSPRIVFEGKIRTRAEYMPRGKMRASYVFNHDGVAYRWILSATRGPKLVIDDADKTLMAQFHPPPFLKKGKAYLEVTPTGMSMLDQIVVTFIPMEVDRRRGGG